MTIGITLTRAELALIITALDHVVTYENNTEAEERLSNRLEGILNGGSPHSEAGRKSTNVRAVASHDMGGEQA
ncbi:hypothetical protein [Gordonia amicalis]|uniref:Uncharacterized protein n=1 Tax=Gordonia amicalis TaxID=89053 RepID=A0ABU4DJK5_9ACTN|nr:hypothetical protein [Gordonia amicalis]MDV6309924.1 hypothetical protein [Gordonia amicalis]